jgi:hypothetical protein
MNYMNAYIINEVAGLMHDGYDEEFLDLVLGDVIGGNRVSKGDSDTRLLFRFQCEGLFNT